MIALLLALLADTLLLEHVLCVLTGWRQLDFLWTVHGFNRQMAPLERLAQSYRMLADNVMAFAPPHSILRYVDEHLKTSIHSFLLIKCHVSLVLETQYLLVFDVPRNIKLMTCAFRFQACTGASSAS